MKFLFLFLAAYGFAFAQQSSLSKGVNYISRYIASDEFKNKLDNVDHLNLVDSLFAAAVDFYDGDIDEAFLALTFAAVPYKEVPIQLPVIKILINYPLISAANPTFKKKNENLPKYLFFDTELNDYGDKDKLAHFFGSAYISYASNIFDLGDLIGYFVEVFEESFKVQSSVDERDLRTNKLGNIFGEILKKNRNILPSHVLIIPTLMNLRYTL